MRLFAVLGHPVLHSLSPPMHRAAYQALGIDAEYVRLECEEDEVERIADLVRTGVLSGANITIPYKEAAFRLADGAAGHSEKLGSANTWVLQDGKLIAHSTDGAGFMMGLATAPQPPVKSALILGNGGAARAIALALTDNGYQVEVAARDAASAAKIFPTLGANVIEWAEVTDHLPETGLLVNATPLGMLDRTSPEVEFGNLRTGAVVYDIVYRPKMTGLLRSAEAAGFATVGGAKMLVGQGAKAFELWFGIPAPMDQMQIAVSTLLE